ncbi:I10R1 protein, partial [Dicaeum eximium]|nr:I10R1 protein [Dicaeum eximium]
YGSNMPWTGIPECGNTSEHSCDLTAYTLEPERRYYAQVRAVAGNRTSSWQRTTRAFSPQEGGPRLVGQSLSVVGNSIQVRLQLLGSGSTALEDSDYQKEVARYHVYVRRTRDNHTITVVQNSTEFTVRGLFWLTEYCLSVEPSMANRPVPATRTAERCVTTARRDSELLLGILSSSMVLLLLGLLGALLARTYVRKPVRTPAVLVRQGQRDNARGQSKAAGPGYPIQQLFLCQKEPRLDSSADSSTSAAQLPLEQGLKLPARPKDLSGPTGSSDSSGSSTDSGICLHIPSSSSSSSSSSLSCSTGPEPQGYRQQLPTAEDSGVGWESPCPAPGCSSGSGNAGPGEPGLCPAAGQEDVEFRGYLQQSKGTVEPERAPDRGGPLWGCAGSVQGLGSTDTVLDMESPELAVAKGYLKQSSPGQPLTAAPWAAPAPTLLSWAAPGAPLTSKASPELRTPLDLNISSSAAFLGTLPLISSLSSTWTTPPIMALSQLSGDSKDSRL